MSNKYVSGFEMIIKLQGRDMIIERGVTSATVKMAVSNYSRNLGTMEEIVVEGKQFVASKIALDEVGFGVPKRGDVIVDSVLGTNSITEVKEMVVLGELAGYRIITG